MALTGIFKQLQVLRIFRFSKCSFNSVTEKYLKNVQSSMCWQLLQYKYLCDERKSSAPTKPPGPNAPQKPKVHKPLTSPEITLILPESDIVSVTLEHAERLSKRRNLKLVKIVDFDTKTEKPVYKLMTTLEFFEVENKEKENKRKEKDSTVKEAKLYTISSKITEHDLHNKINQMVKLLKKRHEIRVYVSVDGNPQKADDVVKILNEGLKDLSSKSSQVAKHSSLKLSFIPKIETSKEQNTEEKELKGRV